MSSTTESSDPYLYPGTTVLSNLRGVTEPEQLEKFEARSTHRRIVELLETPLSGAFDVAHLKAIHRYIFQDVYGWAGEFRTVNISKGGHLFGLADFIESALRQSFGKLAAENCLVGLDAHAFAKSGCVLSRRAECGSSISRGQRENATRVHARARAEGRL